MYNVPESIDQVVELSVSAWFYRNRTIAGFDNPARSLYVSIRELVENSLDAAETIRVFPDVRVRLTDYSSEDEEALGISSGPRVYQLSVSDNGEGISKKDITKLIGKMLTGTKYSLKQSRGTFGLGGSLALLYGQVTTQRPITVTTGRKGASDFTKIVLKLDIEKNEPIILEEAKLPKPLDVHGTDITYYLQGDWLRSKRRIIEYFNQTSMIVPYAAMRFDTPDEETYHYKRLIEKIPRTPKKTKPHPRGVDVEMLKNIISKTRAENLSTFLKRSFQKVGPATADDIIELSKLDGSKHPHELTDDELVGLMRIFESHDGFMAPSSKSLSPAGEDVLRAGMQRLNPEVMVIKKRSPSVHEGHPFIIETGVAYGGEISSGMKLYRFANRIPLLYDESSDVSSRILREMNLKNYALNTDDPLAFVVHLCSTKVPYKTVGKEYIADVDIVRREIDLGFKDCLRRLGEQVRRKKRVQQRKKRENKLEKYYDFLATILSESVGRPVTHRTLFPEEGY